MELPSVETVIKLYEDLIDSGKIDEANLLIAMLSGVGAYIGRYGSADPSSVWEYFDRLRMEIIEGPDYLNPYVMELLGMLAQGIEDEACMEEFKSKLRAVLREDRLDNLEL